jgi:hypothetical protein
VISDVLSERRLGGHRSHAAALAAVDLVATGTLWTRAQQRRAALARGRGSREMWGFAAIAGDRDRRARQRREGLARLLP